MPSDPSDPEVARTGERIAAFEAGIDPAVFQPHAMPLAATWAVDAADLTESNRRLLDYWRGRLDEACRFPADSLDPLDFTAELGTVLLLDAIAGGIDARYRVYGTKVAVHAGRDWTGVRVSQMCRTTKSDLELMYRGCYRAVALRGAPLFTFHQSPPWLSAGFWSRLILPVHGSDGAVKRFLVSNCPVEERFLTREQEEERQARVRRHYSGDGPPDPGGAA